MYSRLFKGEISDAVCGHFDNFNDLLNAIQEKNFMTYHQGQLYYTSILFLFYTLSLLARF
jgi:hypothetical protein